MRAQWDRFLERWTGVGLIDPAVAERIRAFEADREKAGGLRWPMLLAVAFGGLLLGAGVLLFVAAHWDRLSPAERFGLVLLLTGFFHVAGAAASQSFPDLSCAMHGVGTICLGAGIFLAGQIFHLQEHWPGGVMLWAAGACVAWLLLRDWPQAALVALLVPAWIAGEWIEATRSCLGGCKIVAEGLLLLSVSYLTGVAPGKETPVRTSLAWIGGLALIPLTLAVVNSGTSYCHDEIRLSEGCRMLGWVAALVLPLAPALWMRRSASWMNLVAAFWVVLLGTASFPKSEAEGSLPLLFWHEAGPFVLCALGSLGCIAWGMKEKRRVMINLGVAGFGLTVLFFYFSNVMDKLGRSASLIGLGLLFLLGGWLLHKARLRLMARLEKGVA